MNDWDLRNAEYGRDVSWGDADDGIESDNGMLDPAETDLASSEATPEKPNAGAWSQEKCLDFLEREVCRHPLNRELLYKTLELCLDPLELSALEQRMLSFPKQPKQPRTLITLYASSRMRAVYAARSSMEKAARLPTCKRGS